MGKSIMSIYYEAELMNASQSLPFYWDLGLGIHFSNSGSLDSIPLSRYLTLLNLFCEYLHF